MDKKVVITGVNGFVGHHLARELASFGASVVGIGREQTPSSQLNGILAEYFSADLTKEWPSIDHPDCIIHLAGFAAVGPSFDAPQKYIEGNSSMVTNLCEYYVGSDSKPRIILVSSGAIYDGRQQMPISELGEIGLSSPYAVSKVLNENQATYYRQRGLDCIVVRPFNHIGPGQAPGFILPDFYKRLAELDDNSSSILVGNVETKRDYTDVRDIVKAYTKLAFADSLQYNTYNVCSGRSISGTEILDTLKTAMGLPDVTFTIDASLVRPTDIMDICGDATRLRSDTGWVPEIDITQTIKDFVSAQHE